jgi:DtxR family Mn-dependent transcriptional regulator
MTAETENIMSDERLEDELLEAIWTAGEKNDPSPERVACLSHAPFQEGVIENLAAGGFIVREPDRLTLTATGRQRAGELIRRHRLAERLLHDVLNMSVEETERSACEFEHVLAPGVTESICTLLGHPRECPHGTPIPEGTCCREARRQVRSLVVPLTELAAGESARVTYLTTARHPRIHKLLSFGITPGALIKLHQRYPSYIIQCGNTEVAIEEEIARDIQVRREG